MPRARISRRAVLRGAAGAVIALPLLEAMGCDESRVPGATVRSGRAGPPRRFLATHIPNGIAPAQWWPSNVQSETQFDLSESLAPFASVRDEMIVLRGLTLASALFGMQDGHREGSMALLTGSKVRPDWRVDNDSLDVHLASQLGHATRLPALALGAVGGWANHGSLSHFKDGGGPNRLVQPLDVFVQLFGDPNLDPDELARLVARRKSVLDRVASDYEALSPKIGGEDRLRIDAHLDAIRAVELSLGKQVVCDRPMPDAFMPIADADLTPWFDAMTQLVVLAFQCDITRVITLTFRNGGGGTSYFPWLGLSLEGEPEYGYREHHEVSHFWDDFTDVGDGESKAGNFLTILDWHLKQLAKLVAALKTAPEAEGFVLDNTAVLHGSEHSWAHDKNDMPFLLFGRAGGAFKPGRYLQYGGVPHNQLLVAVMNAMGVPGDSFGEPSLNAGPLPGLG
ncbi:DUF1552 domain-containing protein [Nannocystis radixulma]|uniref:DUF1552 domain-containing protein n=1 Tax=Nannocystis radixulma TaxID=2995305 RepID=A0ABT5AYZ9_9BACT|nr:DUF1552 domain-containing protein [Nannocystis radixulma]MDC0667076.1 DUF1552 domain-containing protein [Nannocystis radixulma]